MNQRIASLILDTQSRFVIGIHSPQELVDAARDLIVNGVDQHSVVLLAGLTHTEYATAAELFEKSLIELNVRPVTKFEALTRYARKIAHDIADGTLDPCDGATKIWDAQLASGVHDRKLDPFVYAASEYKDRPHDRSFFDKSVLAASKALLTGASQ